MKMKMFFVSFLMLTVSAFAQGAQGPTLPDTGVNLPGLLVLAFQAMGAVVAIIIGGFIAFQVIKHACKWIGKAFG